MARIEWQVIDDRLRAKVDGKLAVWFPQPGSQTAFLQCPVAEVLLEGNRGGGKCLLNTSRILTDTGWKTVGAVTLSDRLVSIDGTYTQILGIFPHDNRPLYRVRFCDGAEIVADDEHRWTVRSGKYGFRTGWQVKTTAEILASKDTWSIPLLDAPAPGSLWQGPDPYLLGLLLGDGTLTGKFDTLYTGDTEIRDYAIAAGFHCGSYKNMKDGRPFWQLWHLLNGYRACLGSLSKEAKHVPQELLMADPHTRLRLLQGMMDADGHCDKEGRCQTSTISEPMADAYVYLARSLGGMATKTYIAKLHSGEKKHGWRIRIMPANRFNPFSLYRKASRVKPRQRYTHRTIRDIEPCGIGSATCFSVAHPRQLFVVQDFILTHNTDALLMDYAQHVGRGYGPEWRGIIFRRTFPELSDVTQKAKLWFKQIWPASEFNVQKMLWQWPTGETLYFRHILRDDDYLDYIGHAYPWIAFEELVTWPTPTNYLAMMACNRSSVAGIPLHYRSTTNAYGPGHNWIKKRWRLPVTGGRVVGPTITNSVNKDGLPEPPRCAIRSSLSENKIMLYAQPDYAIKVAASAANAAQRAAWLEDNWDITAGGMFDDLWQDAVHVVPDIPFELLIDAAKAGWFLNRAYDHGQSKPFSVGWWAVSNGEPIRFPSGRLVGEKKGDLIRFNEWYGWTGEDDEGLRMSATDIARGIKDREKEMKLWGIIKKGPADSAIFAAYDGVKSVAKDMAAQAIYWDTVDKSGGSRHQGWQQIRKLLKAALPSEHGPREEPGLFVCERCVQFRRAVPCLSRADKDPDDVNSATEDHIGDETRYRCRWVRKAFSSRSW